MPYYKGRRRYTPKRGYAKKKKWVRPAVKTYVNRAIAKRVEPKYWDDHYQTSFDALGGSSHLMSTGPTQGLTDTNRIGDRIRVRSIEMRGFVTVADSTNLMRLVLVQWKADTTDYTPTISDVLGVANQLVTPLTHDRSKSKQFNVLMDRMYTLEPAAKTQIYFKHTFTRGFARNIQFKAATNKGTNQFILFGISDSGVAPHPNIDVWFRTNYGDA